MKERVVVRSVEYRSPDLEIWLHIRDYDEVKIVNILVDKDYSTYTYYLVAGDKRYPAFWDYGNYIINDSQLLRSFYDYHRLYSLYNRDYNQFLVYSQDYEEFALLEVEKVDEEDDPESSDVFIDILDFRWHCPKSIYDEWFRHIYWKRPYYLTIQSDHILELHDRHLSVHDIKPDLVLRCVNDLEYYLVSNDSGTSIYKHEKIWGGHRCIWRGDQLVC